MTTGVPLYLVSACASAEEFVAAFRRYADRTGLFVPSATPLPAGRRGRIAVTLKDGGVMLEGEAEILQSSNKPTILYGRPGMTIKFVEPDDASKVVMTELEKARLAIKPAPTKVTPRPANVPDAPRPLPPPTGGRIDAANALAECVVIGDPALLRDTAKLMNESSGSRLVVPSIPSIGAPRSKTPSVPPQVRPKPTTTPPVSVPRSVPNLPGSGPHKMTSIGFPVLDKAPARPEDALLATQRGINAPPNPTPQTPMKAQHPLLDTTRGAGAPPSKFVASTTALGVEPAEQKPSVHDAPTSIGAEELQDAPTAVSPPLEKTTDPMPAASPTPSAIQTAVETTNEATAIGALIPPKRPEHAPSAVPKEPSGPARDSGKHKPTSIGFPVARHPFETQPLKLVPPAAPVLPTKESSPGKQQSATPVPRGRGHGHSVRQRLATPVAPMPMMRSPAKSAPVVSEDEKTDISEAPIAPAAQLTDTDDSSASHALGKTEPHPAVRSGGMRASEILAAIPTSGDWTMAPDESEPHILPQSNAPQPVDVADEKKPEPPKGAPTGDWTISLDPATGWSEPSKVETTPGTPAAKDLAAAATGNRVGSVASAKPITAQRWDDKPTGIGEAKIEIDPTLMEPLREMPADDDDPLIEPPSAEPPQADAPPPLAPMPPMPPMEYTPPPYAYPPMMEGSGQFARNGTVDVAAPRSRSLILLVAGGVLLVAAIIAVVVVVMGKRKESAPPQPIGSGSGNVAMVVEPEKGSAKAAPPVDAAVQAPPGKCIVEVTTTPAGADVIVAKKKLGATPGSFELPCGTAAKLTIKKAAYTSADRTITPAPDQPNKLVLKLSKLIASVKVTSSPPGATVKAGGKTLGVTPTTIQLPGGEATTLTLTKPGFTADTKRVTPKPSGTSLHVTLKKKR